MILTIFFLNFDQRLLIAGSLISTFVELTGKMIVEMLRLFGIVVNSLNNKRSLDSPRVMSDVEPFYFPCG